MDGVCNGDFACMVAISLIMSDFNCMLQYDHCYLSVLQYMLTSPQVQLQFLSKMRKSQSTSLRYIFTIFGAPTRHVLMIFIDVVIFMGVRAMGLII